MVRFAAVLLLAVIGTTSHAACDTGLAERMSAKLHPGRLLDHQRAACEPWRGVPRHVIVVLPLPRPASDADTTEFDLDVLVVLQADNGNSEHSVVVSRLFQEKALREDEVRIRDIEVDPTQYRLAPDARAFGLRVLYRGTSNTRPYARETLTLYVPHDTRLRKVLDGQQMALERGEWDADCGGAFTAVQGNLSVVRGATSHGYADLLLRQNRRQSRSTLQGDECLTRKRKETFTSTTLHFDGTVYRAAKSVKDAKRAAGASRR